MSDISGVLLGAAIIMVIGASLLTLAFKLVPWNTFERPVQRERFWAVTGPALIVGLVCFVVFPNWFLAALVFAALRWYAVSQQEAGMKSRARV